MPELASGASDRKPDELCNFVTTVAAGEAIKRLPLLDQALDHA